MSGGGGPLGVSKTRATMVTTSHTFAKNPFSFLDSLEDMLCCDVNWRD